MNIAVEWCNEWGPSKKLLCQVVLYNIPKNIIIFCSWFLDLFNVRACCWTHFEEQDEGLKVICTMTKQHKSIQFVIVKIIAFLIFFVLKSWNTLNAMTAGGCNSDCFGVLHGVIVVTVVAFGAQFCSEIMFAGCFSSLSELCNIIYHGREESLISPIAVILKSSINLRPPFREHLGNQSLHCKQVCMKILLRRTVFYG